MFKVFIYLYIFLESVLCKTWFWLFAQSGEVGAAVTIAVGIGSWAMSQSVTTEGEKGSSLHREWGAAQDHLAYLVLTGECHPCQERTVTTGSETALCLQPTLPVLFGQLPLWGGALAFFFFFFFFRQPPLSLPRSHNQCKGCSRDLRWFLTSPPQKFSLPHVASLGPCRPGATLGAATCWSYPLVESWSYRCPSWAGDGSSWVL